MSIKCYSELILLPTFEERYRYLKLEGIVGKETFGFDRYMNQFFYRSPEWKHARDVVIARDYGCDLGIAGREIFHRPIIHHMNPIRPEDIRDRLEMILDPEYLITTTMKHTKLFTMAMRTYCFAILSIVVQMIPVPGKSRKEDPTCGIMLLEL